MVGLEKGVKKIVNKATKWKKTGGKKTRAAKAKNKVGKAAKKRT